MPRIPLPHGHRQTVFASLMLGLILTGMLNAGPFCAQLEGSRHGWRQVRLGEDPAPLIMPARASALATEAQRQQRMAETAPSTWLQRLSLARQALGGFMGIDSQNGASTAGQDETGDEPQYVKQVPGTKADPRAGKSRDNRAGVRRDDRAGTHWNY